MLTVTLSLQAPDGNIPIPLITNKTQMQGTDQKILLIYTSVHASISILTCRRQQGHLHHVYPLEGIRQVPRLESPCLSVLQHDSLDQMEIRFLFSNVLENLQYGSCMLLGVRRGRVENGGTGRKADCQDNMSTIFLEQGSHQELGRAQICKNLRLHEHKAVDKVA